MKRAIVLSGGGAKGAYQIGFWKAIRQLEIDYDIVTGTSIGALNGAFMVQGDYSNAFKLWHTMDYEKVLDSGIDGSFYSSKGKKKVIMKYVKGAAKGGLNVPGLENIIKTNLNTDLFYSSKVDYGLVTVKFPSLKPVMLTKNDIKEDMLPHYLLATASCFPAFKMKKIENESYIDGGYYDNMPIDLAIKMGADEIIGVNLRSFGIIRKNKNKDIPVTIITSKNGIGNFLVLEKDSARRAMKLGYNDTMKAFNELDGNYFTFKKGSLKRNYKRIYDKFIKILKLYIKEDKVTGKYKKIMSNDREEYFNKILENTMKAFSFIDYELYRTSYVNILLKKQLEAEMSKGFNVIKRMIKEGSLSKRTINKELICYIYSELNKEKVSKTLLNLSLLFPDSFLCAIYLKSIQR